MQRGRARTIAACWILKPCRSSKLWQTEREREREREMPRTAAMAGCHPGMCCAPRDRKQRSRWCARAMPTSVGRFSLRGQAIQRRKRPEFCFWGARACSSVLSSSLHKAARARAPYNTHSSFGHRMVGRPNTRLATQERERGRQSPDTARAQGTSLAATPAFSLTARDRLDHCMLVSVLAQTSLCTGSSRARREGGQQRIISEVERASQAWLFGRSPALRSRLPSR